MTTTASAPRARTFIAAQERRRFTEFANAVRKHRHVGLCHGAAGVGKTLSAPFTRVCLARNPSGTDHCHMTPELLYGELLYLARLLYLAHPLMTSSVIGVFVFTSKELPLTSGPKFQKICSAALYWRAPS